MSNQNFACLQGPLPTLICYGNGGIYTDPKEKRKKTEASTQINGEARKTLIN